MAPKWELEKKWIGGRHVWIDPRHPDMNIPLSREDYVKLRQENTEPLYRALDTPRRVASDLITNAASKFAQEAAKTIKGVPQSLAEGYRFDWGSQRSLLNPEDLIGTEHEGKNFITNKQAEAMWAKEEAEYAEANPNAGEPLPEFKTGIFADKNFQKDMFGRRRNDLSVEEKNDRKLWELSIKPEKIGGREYSKEQMIDYYDNAGDLGIVEYFQGKPFEGTGKLKEWTTDQNVDDGWKFAQDTRTNDEAGKKPMFGKEGTMTKNLQIASAVLQGLQKLQPKKESVNINWSNPYDEDNIRGYTGTWA